MNKKFKLVAFMCGVAFLGSGLAMNNEAPLQNENSGKRISAVVGNESSATTKSKGTIYIDSMMIIGKYFNSNNDYINIMKVNNKYHDLAEMYHFNPISDTDLFKNMETQYLYNENDKKLENKHQYVYWYGVNYGTKGDDKHIFKRYVLNNATKTAAVIKNGELTIPEQVTSIRNINCCRQVSRIEFNQNLREIGDGVFQYSGIQQLILPEGVQSLGDRCFMDCRHLEKVKTPASLESIGNYCFASCRRLTDVTILGNPIIGKTIFIESVRLKEVKVTRAFEQNESVFTSVEKKRKAIVID